MPKSTNQKQKLLYILDYLQKHTDETHTVSTPQLIDYLESNGIKAERKSIYNDIETLNEFGYDIVRGPGPHDGYKLVSREFELAEVKLLVDLVQSSKFITTRKSRELIGKLQHLVSENDARQLQRQVVVADRNKALNENIYYCVDVIYTAIADNLQIRFQYFDWDVHKQMVPRREGATYEISPWLLTWDDENYYLVAYDSSASLMKHYRVDKMLHIELSDKSREGREAYGQIDVAAYSKKTFGMFAGQEQTIQLLCDNSLIGVIVDRFGSDVALRPYDQTHALARMNIAVSPQFYGWLAGLSGKVKIHSPESLANDYQTYLRHLLDTCTNG